MLVWFVVFAEMLPGLTKIRPFGHMVDALHPEYSVLREECPRQLNLAFNIAALAHHGQFRSDGQLYLSHPVEVAKILHSLDPTIDANMLKAALLHDTLEDTYATEFFLRCVFGRDLSDMVVRCSKASKLMKTSSSEKQDDERILIEHMRTDWRVAVIKVCDRLHNMRTISGLSREKRRRIASQTYTLYLPIAHRLGLFHIKTELGDLALRELEPDVFENLDLFVSTHCQQHECVMEGMQRQLYALLGEENIFGFVQSRLKSLHSIHEKMRKNAFSAPEEVYDISALRLVVSDDQPYLCYFLLARIHELWSPIPGTLKDYIAAPKPNGYASLHTVVRFKNTVVEVQIRTKAMHNVAEHGAASHWSYKTPTYLLPLLRELESDLAPRDVHQKIDARVVVKGDFSLLSQTLDLVNKTSSSLDMIKTTRTAESAIFVYDVHIDNDERLRALQHSIRCMPGVDIVETWQNW